MERQEQLTAWIEKTKRLQRRLAIMFGSLAAIAIGLLFWNRTVGTFALVCIALVAFCSFWVTAAHNASHRNKLAELARTQGKPVQTAHRRWHSR